ncbi:MAG: hypothetical protein QW447_01750, partial [Candidatus Bathyarchaeia archaeon]
GKFGDMYGQKFALTVAMALCSFSMTVMLLTGNLCLLAFAFFFIGASYATWSIMSAIVGPLAPEPIRARWVSIPQTISMFASILAPYVGGMLYAISPAILFTVTITMTIALALAALVQKF